MKQLLQLWAVVALMLIPLLTLARQNDSGWVVFESDRGQNRSIYLMNGSGQTVQPVLYEESCSYGPRWSPDGQWLAFTNCSGASGIFRARANGTRLQMVTNDLLFPQVLDWSPNGRRLLVSSGGSRLHLVDVISGDVHFLGEFITEGVWSGEWIYYRHYHNPGLSLQRIHADTRVVEELIPKSDALTPPSWSPDGTQISIGKLTTTEANFDLYLLAADGSDLHRIPFDVPPPILRLQTWSPDGKWIAFAGGGHWQQDVWRVRPDGTDLEQLTDVRGEIASLQWTPDSQWLLIEANYESDNDIFRLHVDGVSMENLTPELDAVRTPHPAPIAGLDWRPLWVMAAAVMMFVAANVVRFRL